MSRRKFFERRRPIDGFTLIEVLVALALIAVSLTALGSLMAVTTRNTRSLEQHLALVETARAIETGLPDRGELDVGNFSGDSAGYRWRVDVIPFVLNSVNPRLPTPWIPQAVVIKVQSPAGQTIKINTVRLHRRTSG